MDIIMDYNHWIKSGNCTLIDPFGRLINMKNI